MQKSTFVCIKCKARFNKWIGKCSNCNAWASIEEESLTTAKKDISFMRLTDVKSISNSRIRSIPEFDQLCGGGIVPGAAILISGEPGIGKSTLLLQICGALQYDSVYISAEESPSQIKIRAERLKIDISRIFCASISDLDDIMTVLNRCNPRLIVIDSIQMLYSNKIDSSPGTINQIKMCSNILIEWAKRFSIAIIIVGHVTKDGIIAGPKIIEHIVDTVLYFQSDMNNDSLRILRASKNRFGSTESIGVFEFVNHSLVSIKDISKAFVKSGIGRAVGSAVFATTDGNRGIMVEMQALVSKSYLQFPRRAVVGWDSSRLSMICAVIEKKCKVHLGNYDIYFNIVGGIKINEPAADLPAAAAIISSFFDKQLPANICIMGEISLSGDLRPINKTEIRMKVAKSIDYKSIIIPHHNMTQELKNNHTDIEFILLHDIKDLVLYIKKCL